MQSELNRPAMLAGAHGSATAIRYEQALMALAYERMMKWPECQPEIIAKHYVAHATLALNLLELCKARRYSDDPVNFDAAIAHCVDQIKRNHRNDFGIELEWPNDGTQRRLPPPVSNDNTQNENGGSRSLE